MSENEVTSTIRKQKISPQFLEGMIQQIIQKLSPEKIILFGSYVSGTETNDSDLDLLVIMHTNLRPAERQRMVSRLFYPREIPLDIIVKTPEEIEQVHNRVDPFLHAVLSEGIILYARS